MKALTGAGSGPLLAYALLQIHEFLALGEDFAMLSPPEPGTPRG